MEDLQASEKLRLLTCYEPVLKFNKGERFLPIPVEPYLAECRLRKKGFWGKDLTDQWHEDGTEPTTLSNKLAQKKQEWADNYLQFVSRSKPSARFWFFSLLVIAACLFFIQMYARWGTSLIMGGLLLMGFWSVRHDTKALNRIAPLALVYFGGAFLITSGFWPEITSILWGFCLFMVYLVSPVWAQVQWKELEVEEKREATRVLLATRTLQAVIAATGMICLTFLITGILPATMLWIGSLALLAVESVGLPGLLMSIFSGLPPEAVSYADVKNRKIINKLNNHGNTAYCYYGRVVLSGDYIVLQYHYFYVFNDWRTAVNGLNQHEADWEMSSIFLPRKDFIPGNTPEPVFVAVSAHEEGSRQVWSAVEHEEFHPVIYPARGSHANYFFPGAHNPIVHMAEKFNVRLARLLDEAWVSAQNEQKEFIKSVTQELALRFSNISLKQSPYDGGSQAVYPFSDTLTSITDIAWGTGRKLGGVRKNKNDLMNCIILDDPLPGWVEYRGAWGSDSIPGEKGPTGPQWKSFDQPRARWDDPVGWLEKLPFETK